jgi:hypothetical protein
LLAISCASKLEPMTNTRERVSSIRLAMALAVGALTMLHCSSESTTHSGKNGDDGSAGEGAAAAGETSGGVANGGTAPGSGGAATGGSGGNGGATGGRGTGGNTGGSPQTGGVGGTMGPGGASGGDVAGSGGSGDAGASGAGCPDMACRSSQVCLQVFGGAQIVSTTCEQNPCGMQELSCECARSLCTSGQLCQVQVQEGRVLCGTR